MDIKAVLRKFADFIRKNRYIALILLLGLILMCVPTKRENNVATEEQKQVLNEVSVEEKLSQILTQVDGAGEVQVFLTFASGEEIIYQTNDTLSRNGESTDSQSNTVTITDAKRNEQGLIRQTKPPVYQGAIVVCKGADSSSVRLAIMDAVSKATGLGLNKISVMKMK